MPRKGDSVTEESNLSQEKAPEKPTQNEPSHQGLVIKYFNELTDEQSRNYGGQDPAGFGVPSKQYMHERGNSLGVSIKNVNGWVQQAIDRPMQPQGDGISCLLKLYDQNMTKFKLNDCVTFVGILEFKNSDSEKKTTDDEVDQNQI